MGAWGAGSFDNDTANDWAYGLDDVSDLSMVHATLEGCVPEDGYLDSDDACEALAAREVVARLKGQPGKKDAYTEKVDQWVVAHPQTPPAELCQLAASKIDLITDDSKSELAELWEGDQEWADSVADLRRRVLAIR